MFSFWLLLVENGFVNKAVNYNGEMFIIEEVQLYKEPVPITTLRLSQSKVMQCVVATFLFIYSLVSYFDQLPFELIAFIHKLWILLA